jgi:hypothetical protein
MTGACAARALIGASIVLLVLAEASSAPAPPSPPRSIEAVACAARREAVPVTVSTIEPESVGVRDGRLGLLTWKWGMHIASSDRRVAKITGLLRDRDFGFVATTENRNWLILDLQNGALDNIKTVGVAPMRGAPGRPAAPVAFLGAYLVAFPDQGLIERFESKCIFEAEASPAMTISSGASVSAMTHPSPFHIGLAGDEGNAFKTILTVPLEQTVSLDRQDFSAPLGFRLAALSTPSELVPYVLVLWRSANSDEARLQQIHVITWDNVRLSGENETVDIAAFSRAPTAMASAVDPVSSRTWVILVFNTPERGGFDIAEFVTDSLRD